MFVEYVGAVAAALVLAGIGVELLVRGTGLTVPDGLRSDGPSLVGRLGQRASTRPGFVLVTVTVVLALLTYPFVDAVLRSASVAPPFEYWDFGAYTGALHRWHHGEALYVPNEGGGYEGMYLYPPVFLLVVWPFERLAFETGARLWELCTVLFLWGSLQFVVRALGYHLRLWERGLLLWALVGFQPLLFSVKQGQISAFLAGLLTLSLYFLLATRRPSDPSGYVSGVCTGIAGVIKLVYAPVGAHLLADRRRLAGACGAGLGLLAVSVGVFGVDAHVNYLDVLLWGKDDPVRSPLLWLPPYFRPLFPVSAVALPLRLAGCLVVASLALLARGRERDRETFALGVAAMPLLTPVAYTYYLTALLPAVVVMMAVELDVDGRPLLPVLACGLLHVHAYGLRLAGDFLPDLVPRATVPVLDVTAASLVVSLLQPGVWGALVLAGLAGWRITEAAAIPG